jgi:hypothetical protein
MVGVFSALVHTASPTMYGLVVWTTAKYTLLSSNSSHYVPGHKLLGISLLAQILMMELLERKSCADIHTWHKPGAGIRRCNEYFIQALRFDKTVETNQ